MSVHSRGFRFVFSLIEVTRDPTSEICHVLCIPARYQFCFGQVWVILYNHMKDDENFEGADPVELPIDGVLDLHTFHPREVRDLLPEYLIACREKGILDVRIIHGKGTGMLRETVHALLKRMPGVDSFRLAGQDAGSWGATIVRLMPMNHAQGEM